MRLNKFIIKFFLTIGFLYFSLYFFLNGFISLKKNNIQSPLIKFDKSFIYKNKKTEEKLKTIKNNNNSDIKNIESRNNSEIKNSIYKIEKILIVKKNDGKLASSAAFNLSLGLFAAIIANFSGMVSVDINLRTVTDVEGHQGYAFLFTLLYGFSAGYSYTNTFSRTAVGFYVAGLLAMGACMFSGYQMVFS